MAGDLEDFLRRAAERRKAKAGQGGGNPAPANRPAANRPAPARQANNPPRARQAYTDRNTERQVRQEEIVVAEVVEEDPFEARRQKIADAKKLAAKARAVANKSEQKAAAVKATAKREKSEARDASKAASRAALQQDGDAIQNLISMIKKPGGVQQAILLREILDRPEW